MDGRLKSIEEIARAKDEWRRQRAALPFPEKIRIVVQLQKRSAPIKRMKGLPAYVWDIDDGTGTNQPSGDKPSGES